MSDDVPRIVLQTPKLRVVELPNGTKVLEKYEGDDAMGLPRWRDLQIGEGDRVARLLRDWVFEHVGRCPMLKEQE